MLSSIDDIFGEFNRLAPELAKELLPNGHRSGNMWMASGIDDTGKSASLAVNLTGQKIGHWTDYGSAPNGDDHGDMVDLLALKRHGGDRKAAIADARERLGKPLLFGRAAPKPSPAELAARAADTQARDAARAAADAEAENVKIRGARSLFLNAKAVPLAGTPGERYLIDRGLSAAPIGNWPGSLRFHPEVWNSEHRVKMPAMLAMIVDAEGRHIGTQRTYLQQKGGRWTKIDSKAARMILGLSRGGFIPINKGASGKSMRHMAADEPIYGAEGSEKCLAVRMKMPGARICSLVSLRNMGLVVFPAAARRLIWVTDNDKGERELATLERSIAQQQARGIFVQQVRPPAPFKDIDEWMIAVAPGAIEQRPIEQGRAA